MRRRTTAFTLPPRRWPPRPGLCTPACAPAYPIRPIPAVVPYPAGIGARIRARYGQTRFTEKWGRRLIVDQQKPRRRRHRSGGGGAVAPRPPMGYNHRHRRYRAPLAINHALYGQAALQTGPPKRTLSPFTHVAKTALRPGGAIRRCQVTTVPELIRAGERASSGKLNYGVGRQRQALFISARRDLQAFSPGSDIRPTFVQGRRAGAWAGICVARRGFAHVVNLFSSFPHLQGRSVSAGVGGASPTSTA